MAYNDGKFDYAVWDPISGRTDIANVVDRMTIHTAATSAADIYGPGRGPGDTYAHFYNPTSNRIRQHQNIHHKAYADAYANGTVVAVEHQDAGPSKGIPLSDKQIDDDARLFAFLVLHFGLKNRIATVDDTKGLAWHRLGISGNFGSYDAHDRRTWSRAQTGVNWSDVQGKVCPWDQRILQIDDVYDLAQDYIDGKVAPDSGGGGGSSSGGGDSKPDSGKKTVPDVTVDGVWGSGTIKQRQVLLYNLGLYDGAIDGSFDHQNPYWKSKNPGLTSGWGWDSNYKGKGGSSTIKADQTRLGKKGLYHGSNDGLAGEEYFKAIQREQGTPVDGVVSHPSKMVKAMQADGNKGKIA